MEKYIGQSEIEIREAKEKSPFKKLPLAVVVDGKEIRFVAEYYIEPVFIGINKCSGCENEIELFIEKIKNEPNIVLVNQGNALAPGTILKLKNALIELINIEELEMLKNPKMCVCEECRIKNKNFIEDRKEIYVNAMFTAAKKTNFIINEDNFRKAIFGL